MSNEAKLVNLSNRFSDLMAEIKARTGTGLDISDLHDNQLIVKQGDSLQSAGVPQNMAFRNLYTGTSAPDNTLGKDGDLYFRTSVGEEIQLPANAFWMNSAVSGSVIVTVAVNTDYLIRSDNGGLDWQKIDLPHNSDWCDVATDGNGTWLVIGFHGDLARSTNNGASWESLDSLPTGATGVGEGHHSTYTSITYGNGTWIASRLEVSAYSTNNGSSWNFTLRGNNKHTNDSTYGSSGGWITSFFDANFVTQSADGKSNFTQRSLPKIGTWSNIKEDGSGDWARVQYNEGTYFIPAMSSNAGVWSTDGIVWNAVTLPAVAVWSRSVYGGGVWVLTAESGSVIAVSTDQARTWKRFMLSETGQYISVVYSDGYFTLFNSNTDKALRISAEDFSSAPTGGLGGTGHGFPRETSTDLATLSIFFTTDDQVPTGVLSSLVHYSKGNASTNKGVLHQTPNGITEMWVFPDGAVNLIGKKSDMTRLGKLNDGDFIAVITDKSGTAIASQYIEAGLNYDWSDKGPDDIVTVNIFFSSLSGKMSLQENQQYGLYFRS